MRDASGLKALSMTPSEDSSRGRPRQLTKLKVNGLSAAGVPDRPGSVPIQPFSPDNVCAAQIVNCHLEIIAEGKTETGRRDVAVASDVGRDPRFLGPGGAAVRRTAVERVPVRSRTSIHPGDTHVTRNTSRNGGKGMLHAQGR